jgi:Domain of unknown function (DUF3854)
VLSASPILRPAGGGDFSSPATADLAGLIFPYLDPHSGRRVTCRLRRDRPEVDAEGKPRNKYLSPYGDNRHLYFAPGAGPLLANQTVPVVFVEAEKSSLAIAALAERMGRQLLCVGTGGCWSWRGKIGTKIAANGSREEERGPLPDLLRVNWEAERAAIIAFDSNSATSRLVRAARWAFAQTLMELGAKVLFADIPGEGGVNGPDDLIRTAGNGAMFAVLDRCQTIRRTSGKGRARDCRGAFKGNHPRGSRWGHRHGRAGPGRVTSAGVGVSHGKSPGGTQRQRLARDC